MIMNMLQQLVDFESWKNVISRSEKNSGNINSEGAICILPNALEARHLDIQGNIYAFGVLLLEIISGRPPYSEDKGCLVDWVRKRIKKLKNESFLFSLKVWLNRFHILSLSKHRLKSILKYQK